MKSPSGMSRISKNPVCPRFTNFGLKQTDEYSIQTTSGTTPTFSFSTAVNNINMTFECVSMTSVNSASLYEVSPGTSQSFNILYRNDLLGYGSANTGFFVYFKQGDLKTLDFTLGESLPNRIVNINFDNINNTDTWLYSLTNENVPSTK